MGHYSKHVFMCVNQKDHGKKCCEEVGALALSQYLKTKLLELGLHGPDKNRISTSGCLGRCRKGPSMVIYPEQVWYRYENKQDIDDIVENHLKNGKIVERLLMDPELNQMSL